MGFNYLDFIDPLGTMHSKGGSSSKDSKSKAPAPPPFASANTTIDGQNTGSLYKDNGQFYNAWNPTADQSFQLGAANQGINNLLPGFGQTDPELAKSYSDMSNAYADKQAAQFDRLYAPQQRAMTEKYASQYGTTKATPYIDAMGQMEQNVRMPAYEDIANNATAMGQQLYTQDLQNRMNSLNALSGQVNNVNNYGQQQLNNNLATAQMGNGFNQTNYANSAQAYLQQQQLQQQQQQQNNQTASQIAQAVMQAAMMAM